MLYLSGRNCWSWAAAQVKNFEEVTQRTKASWQDVWWGLFSEGLAAARFTCGEILRLKTHGTSIVQKWPRLRRRRHCSACGCGESASGGGGIVQHADAGNQPAVTAWSWQLWGDPTAMASSKLLRGFWRWERVSHHRIGKCSCVRWWNSRYNTDKSNPVVWFCEWFIWFSIPTFCITYLFNMAVALSRSD